MAAPLHALLPLLTLVLSVLAPQVGAGSEGDRAWPGAEGALSNDALLPTSAPATEALARGDRALVEGRPDTEVFDRWHDALEAAGAGTSVPPRPRGELADIESPWPDPDGTAERRTEGVEHAVLRRLRALEPARRRAFALRFAALAADELRAAGGRPEALAELERRHPGTTAAAHAAVWLCDLAFEEGRTPLARLWLERARGHAQLGGGADEALGDAPGEALGRGLASRASVLAAVEALADDGALEHAWRGARALRPAGFVPLPTPPPAARARGSRELPSPGAGVQPGADFMADGTLVVQTAERLVFVVPGSGPAAPARVRGEVVPGTLMERAHWISSPVESSLTDAPGWPLLPLVADGAVLAVQGRSDGRAQNALVCVDVAPLQAEGPVRARLRWALRGDELLSAGGVRPSGLDLELVEFQPGLVRVGTQVFAQAREITAAFDRTADQLGVRTKPLSEDRVPSWLVAVDLATGRVRWRRFLAQGLTRVSSGGSDAPRFLTRDTPSPAAQPLAVVDGRLVVGTHLGVLALVELDGRVLHSFKNRRRSAEQHGWSGCAPVVAPGSEEDPAAVLFAPADSDHLYWLRADPSALDRGPLLHAPRAIGEAEVLFGGGRDQALVLVRYGRERNASAWLAESGGRHDAPYLGPGERFTGSGLASDRRALFATQRGLVLLDRTRELYLLDYAALEPGIAGLGPGSRAPASRAALDPGGSVVARGSRVAVVGPLGVFLFEVE